MTMKTIENELARCYTHRCQELYNDLNILSFNASIFDAEKN